MLGGLLLGLLGMAVGAFFYRVGKGVMGHVPREQDGPSMPRQRFGINDRFIGQHPKAPVVVGLALMAFGAILAVVNLWRWLDALI